MTGDTDVAVWYCEAIEKIRATASPGGDALDVDEAEALRDDLDEAIATAKRRADG
jgi:hypothetical protein